MVIGFGCLCFGYCRLDWWCFVDLMSLGFCVCGFVWVCGWWLISVVFLVDLLRLVFVLRLVVWFLVACLCYGWFACLDGIVCVWL